jgi:general secretion pathway protein K
MTADNHRQAGESERGVALLTVLLVTALMTVLVLAMTWDRQLELRRTANLVEGDQALLLALGLEQWAGKILHRDRSQNSSDHLGEIWAMGLPPTPVEQGMVAGGIRDLQGGFNLNNLLDTDAAGRTRAEKQLRRLLELCDAEPLTVAAVTDWLDPDTEVSVNGAEDGEYLIRQPPYRTGNQPMLSPTELLLVAGIDRSNYDCLAGAITTLPGVTTLNVNTASPLALASISDLLPLEKAEELVRQRPAGGYQTLNDFQAQLVGTGLTSTDGLSLASDYFLVEARTIFGHADVTLYSVVRRTTAEIEIIGRGIGTL